MGRRRGRDEGSIYKRGDGRWTGAVTLGYEGGKRKRKSLYGRTRKEVQEKLTKVLRDQQQGLPVPIGKETVGQFLERWLKDSAKPRLRSRTFEGYEQIVAQHLKPVIGTVELQKLVPHHVQQLLNEKTKTGLSPSRVGYIRAVLRTALNQALKWQLVGRNVATLVDVPRVQRYEPQVLNPDQARSLLEKANEHRVGVLFSVALAVGLRLGEALGLAWEAVDLDKRTLTVRQALQRVKGKGLRLVEPKSKRSFRTLALPKAAVEALNRHRARQNRERLVAGGKWSNSGLVFTSTLGTPLDDSNVRRAFTELLGAAGLARMRIHDLRHTCASLLLAQGVHPRVVMEILGHSQISLTLDTYSHVLPALEREAANQMDAVLSGR